MLSAFLVLTAALVQAQEPPPGLWERDALLGDLGGVRTRLGEKGITSVLAWTGEVLSNVSGGTDTGTIHASLLDFVLDCDLDKFVGWSGGSLRLNPMWIEGGGLTRDHVGDLTRISNIDGRDEVRLFEAWLQQSLFDGRVSLRAGILAADQEFLLSSYSPLYVNGTFGMPILVSVNEPAPVYPLGAPGVRLRLDPASGVYVQGAVYDGDPGAENFNETGLRLRFQDEQGLLTIVEAGWTHGTDFPGAIKAGAFYHSADFVHHDSGDPRDGHHGLYFMADQLLLREASDDPSAGLQGLAAFVRIGGAPEDRSLIEFYVDGGLNYIGPIPGRDTDVLGVAVAFARLSGDYVASQAEPSDWDREVVFEVTYKIALAPWLSVQPDFQYIVHPGGTTTVDDAFVLGIRVDMIL